MELLQGYDECGEVKDLCVCPSEQQIIETLATMVMGWEKIYNPRLKSECWWVREDGNYRGVAELTWNPLRNIADAWQVLDKLESLGWSWELKSASHLHPSIKMTHYSSLKTVSLEESQYKK
jgi:Phage ABA sandwich domain